MTNAEADRLARELAARTGETLTEAVVTALRERIERLSGGTRRYRLERLAAISREAAEHLRDKRVTTDDLYGPDGLPT